jgi:Holliday junction resolvase RusA-like endonuclease
VTQTVFVPGDAVPQGSMRAIQGKHARFPSVVASNKQHLAEWRAQMAAYIKRYVPVDSIPKDVRFAVRIEFALRRPSTHYLPPNSKRTQPELRENAPVWVERAPDLDKLVRAVLDATTDAGVWNDDAQVVHLVANKKYADDPASVGVTITYSGA